MLVGTLGSVAVTASPPDSPILLKPAGSVDTLLFELAVYACDAAVLAGEVYQAAEQTAFAAVCSVRPAAAVWVEERSGAWYAAGAGKYGPVLHTRLSGPVGSRLGGARFLWLGAWAKWLSDTVQELNGIELRGKLFARCFLKALEASSARDLASGISNSQRDPQGRLSRLRLRGPKRFVMVARVFRAWEYLRTGKWTAERVAYTLGFASLSGLDRCCARTFGLPPRELGRLTDLELLRRIVEALKRPGGREKGQISA